MLASFRMKLKGSGGKSEEAQNTLRELTTIRQRYDALGTQLKSRSDKIRANSEKLAEWDLTRDALARWASHEAKRLVYIYIYIFLCFIVKYTVYMMCLLRVKTT